MGFRLPSYRANNFDHCPHSSLEEPCWGNVEIRDEQVAEDYSDSWVFYGCEGHDDMLTMGGGYRPSDRKQDSVAQPIDDGE